jgi:hypothetical protein
LRNRVAAHRRIMTATGRTDATSPALPPLPNLPRLPAPAYLGLPAAAYYGQHQRAFRQK